MISFTELEPYSDDDWDGDGPLAGILVPEPTPYLMIREDNRTATIFSPDLMVPDAQENDETGSGPVEQKSPRRLS